MGSTTWVFEGDGAGASSGPGAVAPAPAPPVVALTVGRSLALALALAFTVAFIIAPAVAFAQVPTGLPTREEIDPSRRQLAPPPARLQVDGDIERSPCALADPTYAAIKLTLTSATFNNLAPVDPVELEPAWRGYVGTEQPIAVVCDIRDAAATILRRKGYLAAVQVPVQRIEGGQVRFEVLYARLTAVRVRGDAGRNEQLLGRYLGKLATGTPFNRVEAERYLLLARDIPGLDVRLALKPAGTAVGDMIGEVSVRRTPFQLDLNVQNYAPIETGRFGGQLGAQLNGLTGLGDRTTASFYTTADFDEQQVVALGHDFAIGGEGFRLGGRFTHAWSHPDIGPGLPAVRARSLFLNLEARYPLVRSLAFTLNAAAGFDYIDQDVDFAAARLSEDRLRVLYARLDADAVDMRGRGPGGATAWRLAGSLEARQGIDIFGASRDCRSADPACLAPGFVPPALFDGSPTATVLRVSGLAEWRFAKSLTLVLLPRAQVASAPLVSFEQVASGNYTIGRGYDPGTLVGDSGIGFVTELRFDRLGLLPEAQVGVQPFAFVDTDWIWNRNSPPGRDPQQVSSVGAGARFGWADRARLDLTLAVPLRDAGRVESGDVRILVSFTTRLVPWRRR